MSERAPSKSSKNFHEKVRNFFFPLFAPPLTSKVASETEKRDASVCKVGLHWGRKWVDGSSKTSMAFKDCRVMARGRRSRRWVYFWIISRGNISKTGKVPRVHRKSEIRKDLSHVICVYFHFFCPWSFFEFSSPSSGNWGETGRILAESHSTLEKRSFPRGDREWSQDLWGDNTFFE